MLDVAYRTVDTPVGALLLAATEAGPGPGGVRPRGPRRRARDAGRPGQPADPARARPAWTTAARQLDEYFAGRRTRFDLPLDLRLSTGFRRTVLPHLPDIAYGRTASYAQVAAAAGNPRAVRAVGTACATNPLPVVRALPPGGAQRRHARRQYVGGAEAKRALLTLEAAA